MLVGDTGFEPVTSSVSGNGSGYRQCSPMSVFAGRGLAESTANVRERQRNRSGWGQRWGQTPGDRRFA